MDTQKLKSVIMLGIIVAAIVGITLFVSINVITPKMRTQIQEEEKKKVADTQNLQEVIVASQDIPMGSIITKDKLTIRSIPAANSVDPAKVAKSKDDVEGKIAKTNIFVNEQILMDKVGFKGQLAQGDIKKLTSQEPDDVEQSDKYITVDIPIYNFVNGAVTKGSLVDILIDKGKGKYDVVLSKIIIYDKKEIGEPKDKTTGADMQPKNQQKMNIEQDSNNAGSVPGVGSGTGNSQTSNRDPFKDKSNPAFVDTNDFRVTLKVNELEHKRLFQAMTEGKLMTRLYVLPSQDASIVTYSSSEEKSLKSYYNSLLKALDTRLEALKLKNKTFEKEDQDLYDRLNRMREELGLVKKPESSQQNTIDDD